jgi:type I site-specific restriction endonuclease
VTNKGGQCLTNEAAMNLLEAEAAAKSQKLIDSEIKKKGWRGNKKKGTRREGTK